MKRIVLNALALLIALSLDTGAQQPAPSKQPAQKPKKPEAQSQQQKPQTPVIDRRKLPLADRPNLSLADVNTDIGVDRRVIVTMAALNIAGYDYESGNRQLSASATTNPRRFEKHRSKSGSATTQLFSETSQRRERRRGGRALSEPRSQFDRSASVHDRCARRTTARRRARDHRLRVAARRILSDHGIFKADAEISGGLCESRSELRRGRRTGARNVARLPAHRTGS